MHTPQTFARDFYDPLRAATRLGGGGLGGKASGLLGVARALAEALPDGRFDGLRVNIPRLLVLATDAFDSFLELNGLRPGALGRLSDAHITQAFLNGELPAPLLGDLRSLAAQVVVPLAVRSSSLLEDARRRPFAGVYATKLIPSAAPETCKRFEHLTEAIKLVWASTFFASARRYRERSGIAEGAEKMAVVVQEVVGRRYGQRFYPAVSGVARSYDVYPFGGASPADGTVLLALGLGRTIVEGGLCWRFNPARPTAPPPFNGMKDRLDSSQQEFWAINMGRPQGHDPTRENEHLVQGSLADADYDDTLRHVASTYVAASDRVVPGTGCAGARLVDFAPLLVLGQLPLAEALRELLRVCVQQVGSDVEIEFAVDVPPPRMGLPATLALLQVRPAVVASDPVDLSEERLAEPDVVVASKMALGNGVRSDLRDIVYVEPGAFDPAHTWDTAQQLARIDAGLAKEERPYLLMGFGRWGTSDPSCGVPVDFSDIAGAAAIVEIALPGAAAEVSQGSHFFHNLTSFGVRYLSLPAVGAAPVDWAWLAQQPLVQQTALLRHVRTAAPLQVLVDGRSGRGAVLRAAPAPTPVNVRAAGPAAGVDAPPTDTPQE